jgi:predicted ATPase
MKLQTLHIRRFRSLYDVELDFANFRVLTGPNGAGKSNVVDAIAFVGEVYRFGLEYAIARAGGIDAIAFRDKRRTTTGVDFSLSVEMDIDEVRPGRTVRKAVGPGNFNLTVTHHFILKSRTVHGETDYYLAQEDILVTLLYEDTERQLLSFHYREDDFFLEVADRTSLQEPVLAVANWCLGSLTRAETSSDLQELIGPAFSSGNASAVYELSPLAPILRTFRTRMSLIRAYRLNPTACRRSAVLTPNATLEMDGGNLPAVVTKIMRNNDARWNKVMSGMRQLMPDLELIDTEANPEYGLMLRFHEAGRGRPWYAREVSDGIIQSLAMLLVLYDSNPPLLIIEEPENAVHPWVLRRFIENCRSASDRQIVLTTHSPVVLSLTRPEELILLWRKNGRSHLKPLTEALHDSRRLYTEEGFDVFEMYDSGLIGEAIPGLPDGAKS